ncbi:MAG: site-specific DNA-methyltransferase [Alphaproteobacteria bacterium]
MAHQLPIDKILHGEATDLAKTIFPESVDVVFADPPYNLQLQKTLHRPDQSKVNGVHDLWDKFDDFRDYDKFTYDWLQAMKKLLKPDGSLWVIGSYHNIFRVGKILQDLGYWILNDIVWIKHNPMPNFKGRRFTNAHETLIWASKNKKAKYQFHYHAMKSLNDDLQMRSDWYLPICSGGERIKTITKNINNGRQKLSSAHPTQKPESLLQRIILATSRVGDVVLDPFAGSGTSLAVCKKLRRHYIGFEQSAKYVAITNTRLSSIKPIDANDLQISESPLKQKRIAFGRLVEQGVIKVGEELVSHHNKYRARVMVDGSLKIKSSPKSKHHQLQTSLVGSIHQLPAKLEDMASCNGWSYWYLERGKKKIPIDNFR